MALGCEEQTFKILFPEFTKTASQTLQAFLKIATTRTPLSVWGDNTEYATALLAAHMLTASGRTGQGATAGAITAESVGDLSRSYQSIAEVGSGDAALMTTRYGIDYVDLRNSTIVSGMTAGPTVPRGC